jgi:3-oxoadipate CoA-transferase alpha subunit
MIDKICGSVEAALRGVPDGATVMIGGFGGAGSRRADRRADRAGRARPDHRQQQRRQRRARAWPRCSKTGRVRKIICSFPAPGRLAGVRRPVPRGKLELELVPQGNLAERIRAAGAGIGGFFTPTGYGTELAKARRRARSTAACTCSRRRSTPTGADQGRARRPLGNLVYRKTARNFGPVMAMAAKRTVASVHEVVELGALDPEHIVTPGIFVQRIVKVPRTATGPAGFRQAA